MRYSLLLFALLSAVASTVCAQDLPGEHAIPLAQPDVLINPQPSPILGGMHEPEPPPLSLPGEHVVPPVVVPDSPILGGMHQPQPQPWPELGGTHGPQADQSELAQLRSLIEEQRNEISLLKEKITLLEKQLQQLHPEVKK